MKHSFFLVMTAAFLGLSVGALAVCFYLSLSYVTQTINGLVLEHQFVVMSSIAISVALGLLAWFLVFWLAPEASGSGIQEVKRFFLQKQNFRWWRIIPVKLVGGISAMSAHLLLGREGPTVQLGGNLGMMLCDWFSLAKKHRETMMAAGAAAGLSAAFNAPIAGILFIFEEMRPHFSFSWLHVQLVSIACVFAILVLHVILGDHPMIAGVSDCKLQVLSLGWFGLLGVMVGGLGFAYNFLLIKILRYVTKLSLQARGLWVGLVTLVIGLFAVTQPHLVGDGFAMIHFTLNTNLPFYLVLFLMVGRFFLSLGSYSTGVPGGIFSPLLALGALVGLLTASIFLMFMPISPNDMKALMIAGMGGLFAAVVRSPLTSVVLMLEMTKNTELFFPLFITCMTASTLLDVLGNKPIYDQMLVSVPSK